MTEDPTAAILEYLQGMRGYPFDTEIDSEFVSELLSDFPNLDLLEQIKAFRWHNGGDPAKHFKSLRPALRRLPGVNYTGALTTIRPVHP